MTYFYFFHSVSTTRNILDFERVFWIFGGISPGLLVAFDIMSMPGLPKERGQTNHFRKMWWWLIFYYLEKNVPQNLPREHGLPSLPEWIKHSRQRLFAHFKSTETYSTIGHVMQQINFVTFSSQGTLKISVTEITFKRTTILDCINLRNQVSHSCGIHWSTKQFTETHSYTSQWLWLMSQRHEFHQ